MKKFFNDVMFRRFMAMLLCLCMVLPLCLVTGATETTEPAGSGTVVNTQQNQTEQKTAAKDTYYVVAGSDYQATTAATTVTNILTTIKGTYSTLDGFLFAGDYSNSWYEDNTNAGVAELKTAVNSVYPGLADGESAIYVQGNHDPTVCITSGVLSTSGAHDTEGYGVFVINEDDFAWSSESTVAGVQTTAAKLGSYLTAKLKQEYTKPIFVVSHVPLHYTMRTSKNGDSRYANYIFNVLNDAAGKGLNIIFMYGHNHSASWEDSHGGSAVFYEKGDSINIAQASQTTYATETLNFTYMNAGYVGYYSTTSTTAGVEATLTMSLFEVTADTVKISRYSADGAYSNLKSAGVANTAYTEPFAVNTKVVSSPYTLTLNKDIQNTVVGASVTGDGITSASVKMVQGASQIPAGFTAYQTYDITVEGYTGGYATVTLPVGPEFDISRPVVIIDHEKNRSVGKMIVDGQVTFTTDHFSLYTVAQFAADPVTSVTTENVDKFASRVEDGVLLPGVPYLICDSNPSDGNTPDWYLTYTVKDSATRTGHTGVELSANIPTDLAYVWYYEENTGRLYYTANDTNYYLMITYKEPYPESGDPLGNVTIETLNSDNESIAAVATHYAYGYYFSIAPAENSTHPIYLNRYGGLSTDDVASVWTGKSGSTWYFSEVITDATLSVVASHDVVSTDGSILLTPTVMLGNQTADTYEITWTSLDETYATVADGVVTPKKPGQVYIRAELTSAEGHAITKKTFVDILVTVVDVDIVNVDKGTNSASWRPNGITASTKYGYKVGSSVAFDPENLTSGGPYVINAYYGRWYLTDRQLLTTDEDWYGKSNYGGLEMVPYVDPYNPPLWYLDEAGLSYGSTANTSKYLTVDSNDVLATGAVTDTNDVFTLLNTAYGASNSWNIYYIGSNNGKYLVYRDGVPYNIASRSGSSRTFMQLRTVVEPREVALTVAPSTYLMYPHTTESLAATVKVDGTETGTYSLSWTSSDTTVATVDSNGKVTAVAGGNVVITATLTSADGQALDAYLYVDVPIEVAPVTVDDSGMTLTYTSKHKLEQVTDLTAGTACGPFIITQHQSGDQLTGNFITADDPDFNGLRGLEGLELTRYYDYDELWYYDGQYLRYGSDINSTATDNYAIKNADGEVAVGAIDEGSAVFNTIRDTTSGTYGISYLLDGENEADVSSSGHNRYLNQSGGPGYNVVGLFYMGGLVEVDGELQWTGVQSGSRWKFWRVVAPQEIAFTVSPTVDVMSPGDVENLLTSLRVDGESVTNYKVVWSSDNVDVATIYQGKLTAVSGGKTNITATLTKINGEALENPIELIIPVTVRTVSSAAIVDADGNVVTEGEVSQRASTTATVVVDLDEVARKTVYLNVTYTDGTSKVVPITVGMLSNADGSRVNTLDVTDESGVQTLSGLALTYGNYTTSFTLKVVAPVGDDYPDYPIEGSVQVEKTGTGVNFTSTGVAQIELSTTGVPVRTGADVIIMLDTSSSMNSNKLGTGTRLEVLAASLNNLIDTLQQKDVNGQELDIRVAIADFNRYFEPDEEQFYSFANKDVLYGMAGRVQYTNDPTMPKVYTGGGQLDASAFVDVHTITHEYKAGDLRYRYGTNYDYAFDAVYQLGSAITEANSTGEARDLFVVFMSDGAPFQFNYFTSYSKNYEADSNRAYNYWNNWLTGTMDTEVVDGKTLPMEKYFYMEKNPDRSFYNTEGKHWMAEAIKGDPRQDYPVIRKYDPRDTDGDNWIEVPGLGATMYSIGFCLVEDGEEGYNDSITEETMDTVIRNIASSEDFYFRADTAAELDNAFGAIAGEIMYSASNAYFIDTMGEDFDLQMSTTITKGTGEIVTLPVEPAIEVRGYSIYTPQDQLDGNCTLAQIGNRKTNADGSYIFNALEKVTFSADGSEAYSDKIDANGDGVYENILMNDVICASTFWYNTSKTDTMKVNYNGISIDLLPETFVWKVGTISTTELTLSYYAYLTGSMEGNRPAGVYDTNKHAELFYTNYLGHRCSQEVPTPRMPWEQGSVAYAFYLVDDNGTPIVDEATGLTGSFRYSVELTQPVYDYFNLNADQTVLFSEKLVQATAVLPAGYELFDTAAGYAVQLNSDGTGYYTITSGNPTGVQTTYVEGVEANDVTRPSSSEASHVTETTGYVTANTIVWFAVKATTKAVPDTVVVDYGLSVDINVLENDTMMLPENSVLEWVVSGGKTKDTTTYGIAEVIAGTAEAPVWGVVRYTPTSMTIGTEDTFTYCVNYTGKVGTNGRYTSTVTVIPATTIYYEDNFANKDGNSWITYEVREFYETTENTDGYVDQQVANQWTTVGSTDSQLQDEDRPGQFSLDTIDANNIYGYDSAYTDMTEYSLGSAQKVTASLKDDVLTYGTATFEFRGTGFDIISMTSGETGTITVEITGTTPGSDGEIYSKAYVVDTYYGYKYENGKWTEDTSGTDVLYQVPVIKVSGLTYDTYTVIITASYNEFFDHYQGDSSYDFYLDAIRIYDPANDGTGNTTIQNAYTADKEGWPEYFELRNLIISRDSLDYTTADSTLKTEGIVFIDNTAAEGVTYDVADYKNFGPNNELYLAPGQAIAFDLNVTGDMASIQMAMKSVGGTAKVKYYTMEGGLPAEATEIATATDLYYDITDFNGKTVVIRNVGTASDAILSITNVKVTYNSAHADSLESGYFAAYATKVTTLLKSMNEAAMDETVLNSSAAFNISSASVSLEDEVLVNFYYTLQDVEGKFYVDTVKEMGLLSWSTKAAMNEARASQYPIEKAEQISRGYLYDSEEGRYMVQTDGIAAKNLGDTIYAVIYAIREDGTCVISPYVTYSPKQYATNMLAKSTTSDGMKALCVAMLNYGAAAQTYFGYKTDSLMNAGLTAAQKALVADYSADKFTAANVTVSDAKAGTFVANGGFAANGKSASVSFEGALAINYYFKPSVEMAGDLTLYYWSAEDYAAADVLTEKNATGVAPMVLTGQEDKYWADITGIAAKEIDQTYYVAAVYTGTDGTTYCSGVIPYSVSKYCVSKAASTDANLAALAKATAMYGYYADQYFPS